MHTRPFTLADLSQTADVASSGFWNDELYSFTHPHKTAFPASFRYSFVRHLRYRHWDSGFVIRVAVTDEGDEGHESGGRVVGYSLWYRQGTSDEARKWHMQTVQSALESSLTVIEDAYISLFHLDRSVDPQKLHLWRTHMKGAFTEVQEMWMLKVLCVDPGFQRKGIGRLLTRWGKEQARREGCAVGLSSSDMGSGLYESEGFRRWGSMKVDGFPVAEVPLLLWEPGGDRGEEGKARGEKVGAEDAGAEKVVVVEVRDALEELARK